ncbi:hypothetical protein LH23_14300 [Cedecea neteri]|uniref:Uncharacterized protein n=1 Tax=Cedecea neteri TaxID=158822 RepID=A0AAN0S569_9ENTR|nr:hypothetical protein LH23_14300 [Cedecea neteri]
MDKELVGTVDGHYTTVMFPSGERNGVKYYKPQFQSECPYNKIYQTDNISTGCFIREDRTKNVEQYKKHVK